VLYDGTAAWVLPRARRAINRSLNYVDMCTLHRRYSSPLRLCRSLPPYRIRCGSVFLSPYRFATSHSFLLVPAARRSLTYEHRLYKYSTRGFGVAAPMVDFARVDPRIFASGRDVNTAQGLMQLLLLDFQARPCSAFYWIGVF
jgi:hypothetical protein